MPYFSIIIPIYNVEQYLTDCVDSVLCQSYQDYEIILVDDGSPDGCPTICDRYAKMDDRIVVIHKKNAGVSAARNSGIRKSKGKYLCFLDSDDWWSERDFLKKIADFLEKEPAEVLTFGLTRVLDGETTGTKRYESLSFINNLESRKQIEELVKRDMLSVSAWLHIVRADFITDKSLMFDEAFESAEDIEWFIRVLAHRPLFKALDSEQYVYRIRKGSFSTRLRKPNSWRWRYNAIVSGMKTLKEAQLPLDYYEAGMGYIAYIYCVLLGDIAKEPDAESKKEAYNKCRELLPLLRYVRGKKGKISKLVIDIFGIKLGSCILNLRVEQRRRTNG